MVLGNVASAKTDQTASGLGGLGMGEQNPGRVISSGFPKWGGPHMWTGWEP